MTVEILNYLVAGGGGALLIAIINGLFNRNTNKASAAKLVADSTKVANDMVLQAAGELRTELLRVNTKADACEIRAGALEVRVDVLEKDRDMLVDQLKEVIPFLDLSGVDGQRHASDSRAVLSRVS